MSQKKTDKKSDIGLKDRQGRKVQKPKKFKVVMLNDDYTPMEIVVQLLINVFRKSSAEATRLMLDVHKKGRGIAGVYTKEIAETKAEQVVNYARRAGYPLLAKEERVE